MGDSLKMLSLSQLKRRLLLKKTSLLSLFLILLLISSSSPLFSKKVNATKIEDDDTPIKPDFTGTIISFSGENVEPGRLNIQPIVFASYCYGAYTGSWKKVNTDCAFSLNPLVWIETGITKDIDVTFTIDMYYTKFRGNSATHFGDLGVTLAYQAMRQVDGTHIPFVRIGVTETFPTGKYNNYSPSFEGVSLGGEGSYQTAIMLVVEKTYYPSDKHPLDLTFNVGYTIPSKVHVKGANAYGGGKNTDGTVYPGNTTFVDFTFEYSITKHWILFSDAAFTYTDRTGFSGTAGTRKDGSPASSSEPSSSLFQLAPGIEYGFTPNLGLLAGVNFSVLGRNTEAFVSGVFSVTWTF